MQTPKINYWIFLSLISLISQNSFGGDREGMNHLTASGGIAAPSFSTSAFQNAAGLVYIPKLNVSLQAGWDTFLEDGLYTGGILYGNKDFGAAGGVRQNTAGAGSTSGFFGLGVGFSGGKAAFGLAGSTGISPSGGFGLNAGLLLSPSDLFHLGFTAMGINSSNPEWGGGVSISLNSSASLIIDATADKDFKELAAQPGLLVGNSTAALTMSYGIGGGSRQLSDGFAAGGSLKLGQRVSWQAYYNQLAKIYTAISFSI